MARIKKYASNQTTNLQPQLTTYNTFVVDDNPNSTYFRITEFKDTFTGGKNGFLIEGSEHLMESTEIKIEILDVEGNPIYYEPGNGVPEYYEGISKVIAVYIYEDTPIGNAKITILGELKTYIDSDGIKQNIPDQWKNVYNVKWEKTFKANRLLSNEDKVRFYKRPIVNITEIVKPIFSNVATRITKKGLINGSPLAPQLSASLTNYTAPTSYLLTTTDDTFWTASIVGTYLTFDDISYNPLVANIINSREIIVQPPYTTDSGLVGTLTEIGYTASFNYSEGVDNLKTALTGSFAKIELTDLTTFVGDCARVKIFRKSQSDLSDYQFVQEIKLESNELLVDVASTNKNQEYYGIFDGTNNLSYWVTSSNNLTTTFNQTYLFDSIKLNGGSNPTYFNLKNPISITKGAEYTLTFDTRLVQNISPNNYIKVFLSGSKQSIVNGTSVTVQVEQDIITINSSNNLLQKNSITKNISGDEINNTRLYFEIVGTGWHIANVSLSAAQETAFSPDEITFIQAVPRSLPIETFLYRFEFYDLNNNYIPVLVDATKTFNGGNLQTIRKQLKLVPSSPGFQFDSGSNPVPPTVITIDEQKTLLTGSVHYTSQSFDFFGNDLSSSYTGSGQQFPGLLHGIGTANVYMTVQDFTGSRSDINVQLVRLTGEVEGYTDTINIYKVLDGFGGVNHLIRTYRGTQIRNSSTASLEIQAVRIDGINDIILSKQAVKNFSDIQLHILKTGSADYSIPEKFVNLSYVTASNYIKGLTTGSIGSKQIDYNATFTRDSIDFRRTLYLMPSSSAASGPAYAVSSSVLASIILEDLQDGLDSGKVTYNADAFTINPRTDTQFKPTFAYATASFAKRAVSGENEYVTSSFQVYPSMSINKDYVPEYWMYYHTQSLDTTLTVKAIDDNKLIIPSEIPSNSNVRSPLQQTKNLTLTFTYIEPWTSASVSFDKTFTIVPEGKPGDETIVFEITPSTVNLKSNSKGVVNSYDQSATEIKLKQGSRYLIFTGSVGQQSEHGTFYTASQSVSTGNGIYSNFWITGSNIITGSVIVNPSSPNSLLLSNASKLNDLSGSILYNLIIHPYYTSSIYTASINQNYTKILDGPPQVEVIISPLTQTLISDEVGYIDQTTGYLPINTTIKLKEGADYLTFTTQSTAPGTWRFLSITGSNIQTGSLSSSSFDTATINFKRFDHPYTTASVLYNIVAYPYSLGPGHQYTSSVFNRTQVITKNISTPNARSVSLKSSTYTINYNRDGYKTAPDGGIDLTATAFNTTGSYVAGITDGPQVYFYFVEADGTETFYDGPYPMEGTPPTYTLYGITGADAAGPGQTKTWKAKLADGKAPIFYNLQDSDIRAVGQLTIAGVKAGADAYKIVSTNDNTSITADLWTTQFAGTGEKITTFKGATQLTNVSTYPAPSYPTDYDYQDNLIGILGYSSASIFTKSSWITMADTKFPAVTPAEIGNITAWINPAANKSGEIVYKIDFESGRQTQFVTQSIAVQFTAPAPYSALLSNEASALVYKVSGQMSYTDTSTTIKPTRGGTQLLCVSSFSGGQTDAYGNTGYKEKSLVKIFDKSSHITLGNNLVVGSTLPVDVNNLAYTPNLVSWSNPTTYTTGYVVYEIDCEGREKLYKTQSFAVQFEGNTGPGVVMRGNWSNTIDYIGSVETVNYRRDAVIYPPNGNPTTYYAAISGSGPATYNKQETLVGAQAPSGTTSDNNFWQYLGTQEFFVAAKIAIFDESYVKNTINIGTKDTTGAFANIVLAGGRNDPYMAMGQTGTQGASGDQVSTGVIGYDRPGIFLGIYENGASGTTGRFSIKSSDGNRALKWDGDTLTIVGSINQVAPGQNAGTLRGAWAASTTYYANDVVTYAGQSWQCTSSTSHYSTNNTSSSTGYPGAGPWNVAAAAGAPGANGTSGADGANGTSGVNGNNGSDGSPGPGVVYRGNYDSGTAYFHTPDGTRRDVVKYSGAYYLANNQSKNGTATWSTPGVADWSTFGATFSSVATDILLAQDSTITRGLVIGTDGTYTGYIRSVNATSLSAGKGYFLNNLGQFRLGDATSTAGGKYLYWDDNDLTISGIIRLKDGNNVTKVLLDYGTTSTADPANYNYGTIHITGYASGTATFQNGVLTGQGSNGYLQYPPGVNAGTIAPGDWPFAATWNVTNNITPPLTAAYEMTFTIPISSLRKTTWISGTKHSGPYVDMRLYVKNSLGVSVYSGFSGAEYVDTPIFDADFSGNFYEQINPGSPPSNIVLYMSGVNMVAGETYTVDIQYIVYNLEYDNYMTINYYMPDIDITYNASVSSTVLNQVGINVGQDTDRYFLTRPDFLSSLDLTTFPTSGGHINSSFQDRRTIGQIGGTFLLLNQNAIEWHNSMQRIYINNASYPRSNRAAGGNFMTSYIFGGYNRAYQILRAYAFFEPDSTTNCSGTYSEYWWPYCMNIEKITYVTTNTWQVFFVEALQDLSTWFNSTAPIGLYTVVISGSETATGPIPKLVRVFDSFATSFKIELDGEDSSGSRIGILVYK